MIRTDTIPKLLEVYRAIDAWTKLHHEPPSMRLLISLGYCNSSNTVSTWYDAMVELGMAERTISGRIHLLPLEKADPRVVEAIRNEPG